MKVKMKIFVTIFFAGYGTPFQETWKIFKVGSMVQRHLKYKR